MFRDSEEIESQQVKFGGLGLVGTMVRLEIYYGENLKYEIQCNNDRGGASIQFGTDISEYRIGEIAVNLNNTARNAFRRYTV